MATTTRVVTVDWENSVSVERYFLEFIKDCCLNLPEQGDLGDRSLNAFYLDGFHRLSHTMMECYKGLRTIGESIKTEAIGKDPVGILEVILEALKDDR